MIGIAAEIITTVVGIHIEGEEEVVDGDDLEAGDGITRSIQKKK